MQSTTTGRAGGMRKAPCPWRGRYSSFSSSGPSPAGDYLADRSADWPDGQPVWPCSGSTLQPNGFSWTSLSSCPTALGESTTRRKRQSL